MRLMLVKKKCVTLSKGLKDNKMNEYSCAVVSICFWNSFGQLEIITVDNVWEGLIGVHNTREIVRFKHFLQAFKITLGSALKLESE